MVRSKREKRSKNVRYPGNPHTQSQPNSYIVVAIFHHPDVGILLIKNREKNKLQLPSKKIYKLSDSKLGQYQIQNEIIAIANMMEEKTDLFFSVVSTVALYHFLNDQKTIKAFLLKLSSEYQMISEEEEPVDPIDFLKKPPNMLFIQADPQKITEDKRMLPHDKPIILDYLAHQNEIEKNQPDHNIVRVKAIA